MANNSTLALKPGSVFRVLDDGTVSVVDPSSGSMDMVGPLPKSSMVSSVGSSKVRFNGNPYNRAETDDDVTRSPAKFGTSSSRFVLQHFAWHSESYSSS